MSDEPRIQELVELALTSDQTPEEVCRECPDFLQRVRERLALVREVDEQLDEWFPNGGPDGFTHAGVSTEQPCPNIPGYELKGLLGRGGMGVVYRARHLSLDRDVALKMLLAGEFASRRELERFFLEARAIANLSHPNIVQVHDVSERDGRPFFTMELVEGGTLTQWLGGVPQAAGKAAELVGCLAGAIEVAHRNGIIHRDLKPGNVLLTPDGVPKVTDFGLARRMSGEDHLTATGMILGTPSYMAPEQVQGSPVGSSTDVYALGTILYEVLTGRPPFQSDSPIATQMQVLTKDPIRPSLINSRIPRDLETICLRCLHKDPTRRYDSAAELGADLRRFQAHEPIRARRVGRGERALLWGRRHPARTMALLIGLVLLGSALSQVVRDRALAMEQRERQSVWAPRIDAAFEHLRNGEFTHARSVLDHVPDALGESLRQRVGQARRELLLVEQLDGIRLHRVGITEGRFDRSENRRTADLAYGRAFDEAGFGDVGSDPEIMAARIREAAVRPALVGALDDWAFCAEDAPRATWLLEVVRRADPAANPWRERLRDPALRLDAGSATLVELAEDVRAKRTTVQLLVGAAERMREAGVDVVPLLTVVHGAHPDDFWANFALADVRWQDPREAVRYAQAAVAIRPRSSIAHQALGTALRKAGRVDEGLAAYRQAVLVEPQFAEAHGRLGLVLLGAGDADGAILELREAVRLDPGLPWARHNLGAALIEKGRAEEALEEFRSTVQLDPRSGMAHQSLGRCLVRLERRREALPSFQMAVELEKTPGHHHDLGLCLASLDALEAAEAAFRIAVELDPTRGDSQVARRKLLVQLGRGEEARILHRQAIQTNSDDALAWDGYPELCAYLGRTEDHRAACEELLARFGDAEQPRDCERIGRACLLLPTESTLHRAAALIDRAIASSDPSAWYLPYFHLARAMAELRSGRYESAIVILEGDAGLALAPAPELIRAMALHSVGKQAEARQQLAAAALGFDWSPASARDHDSWILHVLRREAEAQILPELADLLAGRCDPRDDDTRAALIGACLARSQEATAARMYEQLLGSSRSGATRDQRRLAARTFARSAAGVGVELVDEAERSRFRALLRDWLDADLRECERIFAAREPGWQDASRKILLAWLEDPAFAALQEGNMTGTWSPSEREAWRLDWRKAEALVERTRGSGGS